jgi:hypothetical protein
MQETPSTETSVIITVMPCIPYCSSSEIQVSYAAAQQSGSIPSTERTLEHHHCSCPVYILPTELPKRSSCSCPAMEALPSTERTSGTCHRAPYRAAYVHLPFSTAVLAAAARSIPSTERDLRTSLLMPCISIIAHCLSIQFV